MITLREVILQRGTQRLLETANLTIHPGRRIGIIGANGSGKSSLFALLMGQLQVDGGELAIPANWRMSGWKGKTESGQHYVSLQVQPPFNKDGGGSGDSSAPKANQALDNAFDDEIPF